MHWPIGIDGQSDTVVNLRELCMFIATNRIVHRNTGAGVLQQQQARVRVLILGCNVRQREREREKVSIQCGLSDNNILKSKKCLKKLLRDRAPRYKVQTELCDYNSAGRGNEVHVRPGEWGRERLDWEQCCGCRYSIKYPYSDSRKHRISLILSSSLPASHKKLSLQNSIKERTVQQLLRNRSARSIPIITKLAGL